MRIGNRVLVIAGLIVVTPTAVHPGSVHLAEYGGGITGSSSAVVLGHINGDAYLDIVHADESSGSVTMRAGETYLAPIESVVGLDSPCTLAIGDLDGDGDNDVAVGQYNNIPIVGDPPYPAESAEILWLRNPLNGGGDWTAHAVSLLTTEGMRDVELADMDRDGDLDIVQARSGGLSWAANDGTPADGGWVIHIVATTPVQPWEIAVADINGDGDLDIVGSDVSGDELKWFEWHDGGGDGVPDDFWTSHVIDADFDGASGVAVGDINGDGRLDVVAAAAVADTVAWFAYPGWAKTEMPYAFDGASSVQTIDMDLDGDLDILATAENGDDVGWFENRDGAGGSWATHIFDGLSDGAVDAAAGDLDADGDPEVVVSSLFDDRALNKWQNWTIHRRFHAGEEVVVREELADPRAIEVADVNGDGIQDIVAGLWTGGTIELYLGWDDTATLWWNETIATGFTQARDVAVADVDGDGQLDILGAAVGADSIRWWGLGDVSFTEHVVLANYNGAHRVEPADFDRDGDIDLAVAAFDADDVSWVENTNGLGTSWSRHDLGTFDGAFDLAVGDLNGDGKPDIVASAYNDDLVEYFLNSPTGGLWWAGQVGVILDGPRGVDLGDIDLDGDLDVVVVVRNDDDILWYENDGTGTGWTQHSVGTGYFPDGVAVRVADLDSDGDLDVAATNQDEDEVVVWKNEGLGDSWSKVTVEHSLDSTWDLDIADINRDGRPDLAVAAGGTADSLVWYPNIGNQFTQTYYDYAPRVIEPDGIDSVLAILVSHGGRETLDAGLVIWELIIEFFRADGTTPLETSEINAMLDSAWLLADTDDNAVPSFDDTLVAALDSFYLVDGVLTWNMDGDDYVGMPSVDADGAEFFFLMVKAADPESPVPDSFIARIPAGGVDALENNISYVYGLSSERSTAVTTDVVFLGSGLFADGFEDGDTGKWSASVSGSLL